MVIIHTYASIYVCTLFLKKNVYHLSLNLPLLINPPPTVLQVVKLGINLPQNHVTPRTNLNSIYGYQLTLITKIIGVLIVSEIICISNI